LFATGHEECIVADKEPSGPLTHKRWKGGLKFIVGAGIEDKDFLPEGTSGSPDVRQLTVGLRIVRVHKTSHYACLGNQLAQQFQWGPVTSVASVDPARMIIYNIHTPRQSEVELVRAQGPQ
jgi:hypothetical protein